jgi:two-component system, NarL family, response regulator NreC
MVIRILIAEDHVIVRQGFRTMLERDGFQVVGEAGDGREAVRLAHEMQPDVAILDVGLPLLNGIDAAREIRKVSSRTRSILVTMYGEQDHLSSALRAGVRGYLLKTRAVEDLETAIREVYRGGVFLGDVAEEALEAYQAIVDSEPRPLTAREREVLQLVAEGKMTKEIASILGISYKTAECHRTRIMQKLNIHETAGLVRYAVRHGLVPP